MEDLLISDPEFTDFQPKTATNAVLRFRRLQKKGLIPWRYPECFIECAALLIVNPSGEPDKKCLLVEEFANLPVIKEMTVPSKPEAVSTHL